MQLQQELQPAHRELLNGDKGIETLSPCNEQSMGMVFPWGRDINSVKQLLLAESNSWGRVTVEEINGLVLREVLRRHTTEPSAVHSFGH